jgi:hypothetical protein
MKINVQITKEIHQMEDIMAKYVNVNQLFNCETCRHHKEDGCNTLCENGESY